MMRRIDMYNIFVSHLNTLKIIYLNFFVLNLKLIIIIITSIICVSIPRESVYYIKCHISNLLDH